MIHLIHEGRTGRVPRPSLPAAVVLKGARADCLASPSGTSATWRCSCHWSTRTHPAWALVPAEVRQDGQTVYALLAR